MSSFSFRYLFGLVVCVQLCLGCSAREVPPDLDIAVSPEKKGRKLEAEGDPKGTDPQMVFDWQHYFQRPPNRNEVEQLENQVKAQSLKDDPAELLKKSRNLNTLGRLAEAEASYRHLLRLQPEHFDAYLELAQLEILRGEIKKSIDYIVAARNIIQRQENPTKPDAFKYKYTLALAYLNHDRRNEGHKILSDLISMEPTFSPAYVALAGSYLAQQKYELAEFITKRGIDRTQYHPDLMNILGVIALQQGNEQKARHWYHRILEKHPDHVPALVNRANISMLNQEYTAAENDLNRALSISPNHINAHIALAILYKRIGRFDAAKASFQKALDLDPESSYARFNLALLMAEQFEDRNTALRLFYEVLQTKSEAQDLKSMARVHIQGLRENQLTIPENSAY